MTTALRDQLTPKEGNTIFNTTINLPERYDGASWNPFTPSLADAKIDWSFMGYVSGGIPTNTRIMMQVANRATTLPKDCVGSKFFCETPPTSDILFTIYKIAVVNTAPSAIGTVLFSVGNKVGTLTFPAETPLAPDQIIYIQSPNDTAGIRNVVFDLVGWTAMPIHP